MSEVVARFQRTFNGLNRSTLHLVGELYSTDVLFRDPIHEVKGLPQLEAYFGRLYDGVELCRFDFHSAIESQGEAMLAWTMHLRHGRFRRGETVEVPGASLIRFATKVHFHQDYFDVGRLIYERIPVLGTVIRGIKKQL